jgi:polyhydroxyalkanoate synthase
LLSVGKDQLSKLTSLTVIDRQQAAAMDREFRTLLAQVSTGMSPIEFTLATVDWVSHLAISPGKRTELLQSFVSKLGKLGLYTLQSAFKRDAQAPSDQLERRLSSADWRRWPFNVFAQTHQLSKDWVREATIGIEGVRPEHEILVHAAADQVLDMLSPANFPLTNPEVLKATWKERGRNLGRGMKFLLQDQLRDAFKNGFQETAEAFKVGKNLAVTPGKVVFQNSLIELIQYEPATETVGAEPVLITPAWIMKYYILDLSPKNSMVNYLVSQGKTVFIISWKNPDEEDRHVSFEDYLDQGIMAALDAVCRICPRRKVHAVGYCIGGTLLSIAAAAMARDDDDRLRSISLFAAQTDFTEAGEILRFISPSQLSFLEKIMRKRGYLGSENMGGAFSALRSSDLIYAGMVDRYLLGNKAPLNDLMSWNADGTRMPYQMHTSIWKSCTCITSWRRTN